MESSQSLPPIRASMWYRAGIGDREIEFRGVSLIDLATVVEDLDVGGTGKSEAKHRLVGRRFGSHRDGGAFTARPTHSRAPWAGAMNGQ